MLNIYINKEKKSQNIPKMWINFKMDKQLKCEMSLKLIFI